MAYSSSTTLCVLQTARSTTPSPFWPDLFIFPWCGSDCISCLPENVRKEQDKTRHLDDFVPTSGPACNHFIQCIFCHSSSTWFWTLYVTFKRYCDKKKNLQTELLRRLMFTLLQARNTGDSSSSLRHWSKFCPTMPEILQQKTLVTIPHTQYRVGLQRGLWQSANEVLAWLASFLHRSACPATRLPKKSPDPCA